MDSVSDICKYHLLCFETIIEVKVMSGHQVKKVKQKKFDLELRCMFLGQIFAKNAKKYPKNTFWRIKIGPNLKFVKSRQSPEMTWKVPVFDMFYVISQPCLKILAWNCVHIFISHCPLKCGTFFSWKFFILRGEVLKKKIIVENFGKF